MALLASWRAFLLLFVLSLIILCLLFGDTYHNNEIIQSSVKFEQVSDIGEVPVQQKPRLILLAGPPKTGSTFLQCALGGADPNRTGPILLSDNFVYLGRIGCNYQHRDLYSWAAEIWDARISNAYFLSNYPIVPEVRDDPKIDPKLLAKLNWAHSKGYNAIYCNEFIAMSTIKQIRELGRLLKPKWNVRILINHRRLFTLLASDANQMAKQLTSDNAHHWPGYGNWKRNLPFDLTDNRTRVGMMFNAQLKYRKSSAEIILERFSPYFDDIAIVPMQRLPSYKWGSNGADPLLGYITCVAAIEGLLSNTCSNVTANTFLSSKGSAGAGLVSSNPSVPLAYRYLADGAFVLGLIPKNSKRLEVVGMLQKEHEGKQGKTVDDFPLKCMQSHTLLALKRLSIDTEKRLFSDWSKADAVSLENEFQSDFLGKKKHCHIDVNATLQRKEWQMFFQKLTGGTV